MIDRAQLRDVFEEQYRRAKGSRRDIRAGDSLYQDLAIDSLLANELLIALEDRYDIRVLHDPRVWQVKTVGELLDLVGEIEREQHAATSGPRP